MKNRFFALIMVLLLTVSTMVGCSGNNDVETVTGSGNDQDTKVDKPEETDPYESLTIERTETAAMEYEEVSSDDGYFTMKIPKGWKVEIDPGDVISYKILVYDKERPSRTFCFITSLASYRSQEALDIAEQYNYTGADLSRTPINPKSTPKSMFKNSGQLIDYENFEIVESLGDNGWGGEAFQATADYKGEKVEGIFTCASIDCGSMYYFNVDIGFTLEEGIVMMLAPEEEFTNYQPVFTEMFSSLTFTDSYYSDRSRVWANVMQVSQSISQMANYTSDLIMDSWERRNNTYDIISQQNSDATLSRDRVYDRETNEVYYTDLGSFDGYTGDRYEVLEAGSQYYNLPVSGTIVK